MTKINESLDEISRGARFAFGENWSRFLGVVDDDRIQEAESSLQSMLGLERLDGLTFLDIGSGSGLFSLAAWRLGAKVHSFDYDNKSVSTTLEMRRRYCNDKEAWRVEAGSVLDREYTRSLGQFNVVYSWGVLHHTGDMWTAMENVIPLLAPNGRLFIALYNDQGFVSKIWATVKKIYCSGPIGRLLTTLLFYPAFAVAGLANDILRKKNPIKRYSEYRSKRGMSLIHDWTDWLGGYPYETAKPENVINFYLARAFTLEKLKTCKSLGCNEFVFQKAHCTESKLTYEL